MRIAITVATAAAMIFASSFVTGVVVPSRTVTDTKATNRPIPNYRLHFGQGQDGSYCPGQFGREPQPELLIEPC